MGNVTTTINDHLTAIFDVSDALYKLLFSDSAATVPDNPANPIQLGLGIMADLLEWNRLLSLSLLLQLNFKNSTGIYLDMIANEYFGIIRASGETDDEYKVRVIDIILGIKVSPAAIINSMKPYSSSTAPKLYEGNRGTAYADCSYSDVYAQFTISDKTSKMYGQVVYPAITTLGNALFYLLIILSNTPLKQIPAILDKLSRIVAAGVDYEIQIESN
jgi:hypothetical protein